MELLTYLSSLSIPNLFSRMPAAAAQGIIWGIMALGVYITFRLLNVSDLTVDGSFATGGAVTVMLLLQGLPAWAALLIAVLVGLLTGLCTGLLHTKFGIPAILAGILTQFALYSINLRIMGKANQTASIKNFGMFWETNGKGFLMSSLYVPQALIAGLLLSAALVALLYWYFGTEQGSAMRATGANPSMSRAQGINVSNMKLLGLALSNGMVALAGGLMTQFQCDAIFRKGCNFAVRLLFVVFGGVVYYAVMVLILWLKLDPNDLKLFTALIVAIFLAVPYLREQRRSSFAKHAKGGSRHA